MKKSFNHIEMPFPEKISAGVVFFIKKDPHIDVQVFFRILMIRLSEIFPGEFSAAVAAEVVVRFDHFSA